MGAITKIRQLSPYFMATILVVFVAFMLIQDWNPGGNQRSGGESTIIGEVNGDKITLSEFEERVREIVAMQRQQNPNMEIDDENIRQQLWEMMVSELLLKQEAKKMGMNVTAEEIQDVFFYNTPEELQQSFTDSTGRFNREQFIKIMTHPEEYASQLRAQGVPDQDVETWQKQIDQFRKTAEDRVSQQKLDEAIRAGVGAAASIISPTQAELTWMMQNSSADVQFVALTADRIADNQVTVTDAEISAWYEKHKDRFEQKRSRRIKYMVFPHVPSEKDTANSIKQSAVLQSALIAAADSTKRDSVFTSYLERYNGVSKPFTPAHEIEPNILVALQGLQAREVFGPLSTAEGVTYLRLDARRDGVDAVVRASHILIPHETDTASVQKVAADLLARARKGEDFGMLASQNSKDQGSARQGGDLGYFSKGRMVKEFEDAAFGAEVGSIVGPVKSQYGFHIIKVTDKVTQQLSWSQITLKPIFSSPTRNMIAAKAAEALKKIEAGTTIDNVGKELKIQVVESPLFEQNSRSGPLNSRELATWAFENEKGAAIRRDLKQHGTVVAQVTDTREPGVKPLEDVKDIIKSRLIRKKKVDQLASLARSVAENCRNAGTLDAASQGDPTLTVTTQLGLKNDGNLQGFGGEYAVTHAAFSKKMNDIGEPIRGERGWYIMYVTNRTLADKSKFTAERPAVMSNLAAMTRNSAYFQWMTRLRENADIKDLRNRQQ